MMGIGKGILAVLGGLVAAELVGSVYMYRRTMIRCPGKANNKRTIKMSGTDWKRYMPMIEERKERFLAHDFL